MLAMRAFSGESETTAKLQRLGPQLEIKESKTLATSAVSIRQALNC
jgi:hypothetical protein